MIESGSVTSLSPGAAGIVSSSTARALISQISVLLGIAVALMPHCGYAVDTQQLRMESSLEMSVVTGTITAAISGNDIHMSSVYTFMIFVSLFINHYSSKLSDTGSVTTTAVRPVTISTANKTDELLLLTRTNKDFSNSAALCFTETWLNGAIPNICRASSCSEWIASPSHRGKRKAVDYVFISMKAGVQMTYLTYNNDKPWFTAKLTQLHQDAYRCGDKALYKQAKNTLNKEISVAKRSYVNKVEHQLSATDPASVWKGLKTITSYKTPSPSTVDNQHLANELNTFYCRFERPGLTPHTRSDRLTTQPSTPSLPSLPPLPLSPSPPSPPLPPLASQLALQIRERDVCRVFRKQKMRKAKGPDGVSPACLKASAVQLSSIFTLIFNRSLELCEVPSCFKCSTIIPVPKKPKITGLNDYRPVALTSVIMKSFERLVLAYIVFILISVIAGINITLKDGCTSQNCFQNLLEQIENISTSQVLSVTTVMNILAMAFNTSEKILESSSSSSSVSPTELASQGNSMLKTSEKLISTLVKPTYTSDNVSFTLAAVEGQVFMVRPNVALNKTPRLDTTNSSVDIDLIGIAKNNNKAAVAFMSFNTMENLLKPDFFNTSNDTIKTMMSIVISATLPKTTNTKLTKPVNFTLKHIREFDPSGSLSCVYWNISEWIVDGCSVLETNSSYTVCSCVHLSTFALIMQTSRPPENDSLLEMLNLVCVIVGLVFFSLALLTFALCQWSPGVNNVARINICISLLLAHLLFLLTQQFLNLIRRHQVLCAVISGVLHFLFLSGFVWMFTEAVLLFICVKNLSQISSKKREVLSSGFLCVIGYTVALVVVAVSVGLVPEGYGSDHCWIIMDKGFIWSFLGPVCVILALNMILFINIFISLNSTLKNLNAEVSQMKQTKIMVFKTLAQFVVLGCSWILGFFTNGSKVLEILFLILNSQQGTFIFLVYCVLNNEVRYDSIYHHNP
ncbi:adhesion G protein-coupled receptor E1-like [Megalobrama amblycephala]|uniref:adhesion G protein-coupled receptor E1-like n=1 Tax=Megalobrama amblycephala TaxID=75352 RepID=UPI0020144C6F|nr:adhesion G protein-coupled receptor E1-like [Megalobrama amblycephala]